VVLAPIVQSEVGEFRDVIEKLKREGFVRARIDREIVDISGTQQIKLQRREHHVIEAVVDRLVVRDGIRARLSDSVETALRWGGGKLKVLARTAEEPEEWEERPFSTDFANPETGFTLPQLTPKHFSFNSHLGACPACQGLGSEAFIDPDLVVPHKERSLSEGAVMPWAKAAKRMQQYYVGVLESVSQAYKVSPRTPWEELPEVFRNAVLFGTGDRTIEMHWGEDSRRSTVTKPFEGVVAQLQQLYETTESELSRQRIRQYMSRRTCSVCQGARLRPEILAVTIDGVGIHEFSRKPVSEARMFIESLRLTGQQDVITTEIRREIGNRLNFLCEVGLGYLTLDRESGTLSGGEAQRIRLATQIGSGLAGCLYVLDEPSIGLHQRDNDQLIGTLRRLRNLAIRLSWSSTTKIPFVPPTIYWISGLERGCAGDILLRKVALERSASTRVPLPDNI
jgi:excinuclease ABC subunit A